MKAKPKALTLPALVFVAVILGVLSCGEDAEKEMLRGEVKTTQARLDEVRGSLMSSLLTHLWAQRGRP